MIDESILGHFKIQQLHTKNTDFTLFIPYQNYLVFILKIIHLHGKGRAEKIFGPSPKCIGGRRALSESTHCSLSRPGNAEGGKDPLVLYTSSALSSLSL